MQHALSIRVEIKEQDGWYMATSPDLPGLVLAHQDRDAIVDDLPAAIRLLYSKRHNRECLVFPSAFGGQPEEVGAPWILIPPEIAQAQLAAAA